MALKPFLRIVLLAVTPGAQSRSGFGAKKCDPAYVRSKDERYSSREKTFEHVIFFT